MTATERFSAFGAQKVAENEAAFGMEVRRLYGDGAVDAANKRASNMSREQFETIQQEGEQINRDLAVALQQGVKPDSADVQAVVARHRAHIGQFGEYSTDAYRGLGQLYADDARFTAYYDAYAHGLAQFLRDAIAAFCDAQSR